MKERQLWEAIVRYETGLKPSEVKTLKGSPVLTHAQLDWSVLGDWLTDVNDDHLAKACYWCAKTGKTPVGLNVTGTWVGSTRTDSNYRVAYFWTNAELGPINNGRSSLPRPLYMALLHVEEMAQVRHSKVYKTLKAAVKSLADSLSYLDKIYKGDLNG